MLKDLFKKKNIKTMNNKMATNTNLSTIESKKQEQEEQKQNHGNTDGCQTRRVCGGMGEKVRGLRITNRQLQNSHGDVTYSIRNGVAKELICMRSCV